MEKDIEELLSQDGIPEFPEELKESLGVQEVQEEVVPVAIDDSVEVLEDEVVEEDTTDSEVDIPAEVLETTEE